MINALLTYAWHETGLLAQNPGIHSVHIQNTHCTVSRNPEEAAADDAGHGVDGCGNSQHRFR